MRVGIEAPKISAPINTNNKSAPGAPGSRNPLLKVTDANRSQRRERAFNAGFKAGSEQTSLSHKSVVDALSDRVKLLTLQLDAVTKQAELQLGIAQARIKELEKTAARSEDPKPIALLHLEVGNLQQENDTLRAEIAALRTAQRPVSTATARPNSSVYLQDNRIPRKK